MTSPSQLSRRWLYGPDVLGILNQAFDDDWAEIRNTFADDPLAMQSARNRLAEALLRAADQDGCCDLERLKTAALGPWHSTAASLADCKPCVLPLRGRKATSREAFFCLPMADVGVRSEAARRKNPASSRRHSQRF
jgi:hypothetical protein